MSTSRKEHLDWCKQRALEYVEAGDLSGAVASMLSDINKWEDGPLYEAAVYRTVAADGMMFRNTPAEMRNWINGFN